MVDVEEEPEENIQRKNDDDYINLYTINIMSGYTTPTNQPIIPPTPEELTAALSKIKKTPNSTIPGGRRRRRRSSKRRKSRKSKRKRKRRSTKKKRRRRRRR